MLVWPSVAVALIFICVAVSSVMFELVYQHKERNDVHKKMLLDCFRDAMVATTQNCAVTALDILSACQAKIDVISSHYPNTLKMCNQLGIQDSLETIDRIEKLKALAKKVILNGNPTGFFSQVQDANVT